MKGRPINPRSARQKKPWKVLCMSRATYYWKKKYGDLPMPNVNSKLTIADATQLKRRILEWPYRWYTILAVEYDVSLATISDILHERTHRDIPI